MKPHWNHLLGAFKEDETLCNGSGAGGSEEARRVILPQTDWDENDFESFGAELISILQQPQPLLTFDCVKAKKFQNGLKPLISCEATV